MFSMCKIWVLLICFGICINQTIADCYLHKTTINCDDVFERDVRQFCENLQDDYNAIYLGLVDFTDLKSNFLPQNVTENFVQFAMSSGELTVIHPDAFQGYTNLEKVDLEYLSVDNLPAGLFDNVGKLKKVFLENIILSTVDSFVFANSKTLQSVVIAYSEFTTLGPNTFVNLTNFEKLVISGNLKEIDSNMFSNTPAFKQLHLTRNQLFQIPARFLEGAPSTKEINLDGNSIQSIDQDAFDGLKLDVLILDNNDVENMPNLKNVQIKQLSIYDNGLSSLDWIENLTELENLNVGSNLITNLDSEVFKTTPNINTLNISGNYMRSFNITILAQYLPHVSINLGGNPWDCNSLTVMLAESEETDITFDWGRLDYSITNVNGIPCYNNN